MSVWITSGEAETAAVGELVGIAVKPGDVLRLEGPMGSGKTVFVRGIARGLGIDPAEIHSPTFGLVHEHQGPSVSLLHLDLYRLVEEDFDGLGLDELMESSSIKVIEWAERLPLCYRCGRSFVIERVGEGRRRIFERSPPEAGQRKE